MDMDERRRKFRRDLEDAILKAKLLRNQIETLIERIENLRGEGHGILED